MPYWIFLISWQFDGSLTTLIYNPFITAIIITIIIILIIIIAIAIAIIVIVITVNSSYIKMFWILKNCSDNCRAISLLSVLEIVLIRNGS